MQNLANELSNTIGDKIESTNKWTQPDPLKPEITNGEITLKIGDYVDYDCTTSSATYTSRKEKTGHDNDQIFKANEYRDGWRVLGVDDDKQLMLLAEDFAQPSTVETTLGVRQGYTLKGQAGYENGVEELNKICSIYGNGKGAIVARSINVDDANKVMGYNPSNTGIKDYEKIKSGRKCYQDTVHEYGNSVKYILTSSGVKYEPSNNVGNGIENYMQFGYYDEINKIWKKIDVNECIIFKSNAYHYYPTTLTETNNETATVGININSPEYKMLFTNNITGADTEILYWLASTFINTYKGYINFGLRTISKNVGYSVSFYSSNNSYDSSCCNVRPIVILSNKVQLKDSGTVKAGCKLYNLSI